MFTNSYNTSFTWYVTYLENEFFWLTKSVKVPGQRLAKARGELVAGGTHMVMDVGRVRLAHCLLKYWAVLFERLTEFPSRCVAFF